ncbi:MAG: AzlD domain-containing protein [Rhizobiales bacterium]|nr:AzlD domain-containing protein [Hyphomicrobiales bacterium]
MQPEYTWLIIILAGLCTWGLRLSFVEFHHRIQMPEAVTRALRYVPAAVLSAIIFPALLRGAQGGMDYSLLNPKLLAGIVAGLIAWRTKNMLITILVGLPVLWGFQALLG